MNGSALASTSNVPRFLHNFDETIDGGLILPRGRIGMVASLAEEASSRLEITDQRSAGAQQDFTFAAKLTGIQQAAADELTRHEQSRRRPGRPRSGCCSRSTPGARRSS